MHTGSLSCNHRHNGLYIERERMVMTGFQYWCSAEPGVTKSLLKANRDHLSSRRGKMIPYLELPCYHCYLYCDLLQVNTPACSAAVNPVDLVFPGNCFWLNPALYHLRGLQKQQASSISHQHTIVMRHRKVKQLSVALRSVR